jgi:hypothetical protein
VKAISEQSLFSKIGLLAIILAIFVLPASSADLSVGITKCGFIDKEFKFRGTSLQQAACLLRRVMEFGHIVTQPATLPVFLRANIGKPVAHDRNQLRAYLSSLSLDEEAVGGSLDAKLSRANNNDSEAPEARYFVIHDTSTELKEQTTFPSDMDTADNWNDLSRYARPEADAHFYINRRGEGLVAHDLSVPCFAIRLERDDQTGGLALGLFIHVELEQLRLKDPAHPDGYFSKAPQPGFTNQQYEKLALMYLVASTRAGRYLVPGFHGAIDEDISGSHDDPQNFDLGNFDKVLMTTSRKILRTSGGT